MRENTQLVDQLFAGAGDNQDLLRYLILEGYLDDTYYQYISLFHSGRLSPNDNNFLIKIRAFDNPGPDFPLDNVAEVIASMRPTDFGQVYVLNRHIMDHLFSNAHSHATRIADAIRFISANFPASAEFFRTYYATGARVAELVETLVAKWPGFAAQALDGDDSAAHAARILAYTSDVVLLAPSNDNPLKSFLAENARQVLAEPVKFEMSRLDKLGVEILEVATLADFPEALSVVAQKGLYRISIDNIRHILGEVVRWPNVDALERRHLTTLRAANDGALLERIGRDFPAYVRDVLLALPTNTEEDTPAMLSVLTHEDVDYDTGAEFLSMQTTKFVDLEDIPSAFYQIALEGQHVEPNWKNCLHYLGTDGHDIDILTGYLQEPGSLAHLTNQPIPDGDVASPLRRFIIGNDSFDLGTYRSYIRKLPRPFRDFPNVDASKKKALIEEGKVSLVPASFQALEDVDLQILFLSANFSTFAASKSDYPIDDAFRSRLLRVAPDQQKLAVLADMDQGYVAGNPQVAAIVGPLLDRSPGAGFNYSVDFTKAVIINTRRIDVQISLLNKMNQILTVPDVRDVLAHLSSPYSDIASFGKFPKLENTPLNLELAQWLDSRGVISSFKETMLTGEIKINTYRNKGG